MHVISFQPYVQQWLRDDLGRGGDLTTDALFEPSDQITADLVAREAGVIAGLDVAFECFRQLDSELEIVARVSDGGKVEAQTVLATLSGSARAILGAERTALNILGSDERDSLHDSSGC